MADDRSDPHRFAAWASVAVSVGAALLVVADGGIAARVIRLAAALAAGALLARAAQRGVAGLAVAVVGAAATTTGLALAGSHLSEAGPTLVALAGAVLGVGGIALLGATIGRAVRRAAGWRKMLAPVGSLAALAATAPLVAIPVLVTNVPATTVDEQRLAELGRDASEVRIPADGGIELAGWYVPPRNGTVVIVLHGSGSTRSATVDQAVVITEHGYGALLLDARGHGDSGGRAMDLGWYGDADVTAAIDWLAARRGPEGGPRIALLGLSMGGEEAIGAAAADDRIEAVVAEGATGRVAADMAWLSDRYGLRGAFQELIDRGQEVVVDLLTDAAPPSSLRSAAAAAGVPMLLVAAGDVAEETSAARFVRSGDPALIEVWTVPGSDHTGGLATAPDAWEARVVGFLDAVLG